MSEHELGFIDLLAGKSQQRLRRLLELEPKRRQGARNCWIPRYCQRLTDRESLGDTVEQLLRSLSAPKTRFVISADEDMKSAYPLRK